MPPTWLRSRPVYLLFVDETGKPDERTFAVGGVAVRMDQWHLLRGRWQDALDRHSWPADREIKWHGTRTGEVPPALADDIFAAISGSPITCFMVIIKPLAAKKRRPDLFATPDDVYAEALMWLAERYQRFLARHDSFGSIVVDSRTPDLDNRLRRFFEALQRDGTPYVRLERIIDALMLGPSHHSIGLQVADLVVGSGMAAQRQLGDASRWHKELLPCFAKHPDTGALDGVGMVVYPKKVVGDEPPPAKLFAD